MSEMLTLAARLRQTSDRYGDVVATIFHDNQRKSTYAELNRASNQVANGINGLGIIGNERVAVLDRNSDLFIEILFGISKAGGAYMGINFLLSAPEVKFILNDSSASILFVGVEFYEIIEAIKGDLPKLVHIIAIDGGHTNWPDYVSWKNGHDDTDPNFKKALKSDVWQLYTSGTTGRPKGVCITEKAFSIAADIFMEDVYQLGVAERQLVCLPLIHNFGLVNALFSVAQGATSVITRDWEAGKILGCITDQNIRIASFVPVMIRRLCDRSRAGNEKITSLKRIIYGGASISKELQLEARYFFNCELCQVYGMTENIGMTTCMPPGTDLESGNLWSSVGAPYRECQVKIVSESGKQLDTGETGEILVKSPWLMKGYWGQPDATAETIRDRWLHTGDGGYLDENGFLFLRDRIKDMIISGGENIYPAELENIIAEHPSIFEACVIGVPDETWGEIPVAVLVCNEGENITHPELQEFLSGRLANFKIPKKIIVRESPLPRNATGKILRRLVRKDAGNA